MLRGYLYRKLVKKPPIIDILAERWKVYEDTFHHNFFFNRESDSFFGFSLSLQVDSIKDSEFMQIFKPVVNTIAETKSALLRCICGTQNLRFWGIDISGNPVYECLKCGVKWL